MKNIQRKAVRFLREYQMDALDVAFEDTVEVFLTQMRRGLGGQKSTLEMIPTYLSVGSAITVGKRVIVADAGGTNFRVATVVFDDNKKPTIEHLKKFKMPGVEKPLDRKAFFVAMAGYFQHVADAAENVGFCFSYPVEIQPDKDGRMIRFSKEVKVSGVEGKRVGKNLNEAFASAGLPSDKHIVLLNDTVATLLAGYGYQNRQFDSTIGFILGTGTNCAYIERNANIKKTKGLDLSQSQIINVESGGMGAGYQGKLDKQFDKTTATPGDSKFEKMISGAYLGSLFAVVVRRACRDGLFSAGAAEALAAMDTLETQQMNEFMLYPYGDNPLAAACAKGNETDVQMVYVLADRLVERAAKLSAINLSAMAVKSGCGTDPTRPICIVAEGTTFYKMKSLKSRVGYYLKYYLEDRMKIYTEQVHVDNATLIGAAIAGLTN